MNIEQLHNVLTEAQNSTLNQPIVVDSDALHPDINTACNGSEEEIQEQVLSLLPDWLLDPVVEQVHPFLFISCANEHTDQHE